MTNAWMKSAQRKNRGFSETCETHISDRLDEHVATITITDPAALVSLAREAPVAAAREAQIAMTTLEAGFNEHNVGIIGAAYASAYNMLLTDRAWEQFLADPGWGGLSGKPKNTLRALNKILLHVMRYVFRAEGENARRRVRIYAGMLQDRFHKGFKPEDVIPLINSRGIENLRKEGVALRKATRAQEPRDTFFDDLNDQADDATSAPKLPQRKLTPAKVRDCVALLNTFNSAMLGYLADQAKGATPRPSDLRGGAHGQSDGQPVISAWRRC